MLKVAHQIVPESSAIRDHRPNRVSRFTSKDPTQVLLRGMLADLDEDQLLNLEADIEYYIAGGTMSPRLSAMLSTADRAA